MLIIQSLITLSTSLVCVTLGNILGERTDKQSGSKKSGTLSRKLSAAMKALGDFTVLSDWIKEQVRGRVCAICVMFCCYVRMRLCVSAAVLNCVADDCCLLPRERSLGSYHGPEMHY